MMSRNMRWPLIASVVVIGSVVVMALVVTSCATPTPPQAEVECFEDSDCPEGQKCAAGACVDCTQNSDCCELFPEQASYCDTDQGKCVAVGCETPADCKEVCPTGNWDCDGGVCLKALECTKDKECCDLHPGEVWKCDEDGNCVKVGCDTPADCEICPGEWECEPPFGDCVKATPTPEPDCTEDADCDAGVCDDGECAQAEPAPAPLPEEEQLLAHILGEFEDKFNAAYESGDPEKLYNLIHPASKRRYGDQCHVYTEYVIEGSQSIVIDELDIVGPETWNYETDGLSEPIDEVIRVGVQRTSQGETNETYIHLGKVLELLYFFTDCGTPPTPTPEPECTGYVCPPLMCDVDADCAAGQVCEDYVCGPVPPVPCNDDADCAEGLVCFDNVCAECATCEDCPDDEWCDEGACVEYVDATITGSAPTGEGEYPDLFLIRVPNGVNASLALEHYLQPTCGLSTEEGMDVMAELVTEFKVAAIDPQTGVWVFDGAGFGRFFVLYAVFGWDDGTFAGYKGSPDFTISESDTPPIEITVDVEDRIICP